MAIKLPDWMVKAWNDPRQNARPMNQPVPDVGAMFSAYDQQSPLQSAMSRGEAPQFGRLQTPANPRIEGAPISQIPASPYNSGAGLTPMPVGQGSWMNRPRESALTQAQTQKFTEQERQQAREQAKIELLIQNNPDYFKGRPAETFINSKEAEAHLKHEKDLEVRKMGQKKDKKPLFGGGAGAAPAAPKAVISGADVANEFGF